MDNKKLQLIKGNEHTDHRGTLCFINDFNMSSIKRMYTITHPSTSIVRAWQAHKMESKYFKCIKGRFLIAAVAIDNWENPSKKLQAKTFMLDAKNTEVLQIPAGYANGFKALDADAQLLVFSDKGLESAKNDQFRFDENLWMNWKEYIN
ncbi:dTDP-4-dehydrorhamnose 3,5-epimerase family protein [Mesonia ostreae]|uniref:dTDP-4-dehydrorhamnose 3,5-epimerase n=1 Tax=Mesonia ostreae TaxID=861110 RepID=A0ABU2KH55_9FLAO|nr:dTDP-4-dehydrorhamnose 3,5-epimerase family protein [Mesonia ostreae]MDT0294036.1 dTDP-4-dehydrorhamnose 3,5-epimerase family protein [Mesonia ostreae]